MSTRNLGRRHFLRGAGGITVALPFLESLRPKAARAQGGNPQRYLQFMHVQGTLIDEWAPSGTVDNPILSPILSPLEPVKDSILVVSNVSNQAAPDFGVNGHVNPGRTVFTCANNSGNNNLADGPSIDQIIADRMAAPTPNKSLQFGIGGPNPGEYVALYAGNQDPVPLDGNPQQVFDNLFGDFGNDPDLQPTALQRLRARRESVLDTVLDQLDDTMIKASAADRQVLERHADKIRELEMQLGNTGNAGAGCTEPMIGLPGGYDSHNDDFDGDSSRAFIDLMVMALACDLTRVGSLMYTNYHAPNFPWLGVNVPGAYGEWHGMVHDIDNIGDLSDVRAVYTWYMEALAYLIEQLRLMPDGDGTLLDHMLLYSTAEMSSPNHSTNRMPIILAGGLDGAFQTGRHVDLDGTRTGELYVSFLNWFGADDTVFGRPDICSGPSPLS